MHIFFDDIRVRKTNFCRVNKKMVRQMFVDFFKLFDAYNETINALLLNFQAIRYRCECDEDLPHFNKHTKSYLRSMFKSIKWYCMTYVFRVEYIRKATVEEFEYGFNKMNTLLHNAERLIWLMFAEDEDFNRMLCLVKFECLDNGATVEDVITDGSLILDFKLEDYDINNTDSRLRLHENMLSAFRSLKRHLYNKEEKKGNIEHNVYYKLS